MYGGPQALDFSRNMGGVPPGVSGILPGDDVYSMPEDEFRRAYDAMNRATQQQYARGSVWERSPQGGMRMSSEGGLFGNNFNWAEEGARYANSRGPNSAPYSPRTPLSFSPQEQNRYDNFESRRRAFRDRAARSGGGY